MARQRFVSCPAIMLARLYLPIILAPIGYKPLFFRRSGGCVGKQEAKAKRRLLFYTKKRSYSTPPTMFLSVPR